MSALKQNEAYREVLQEENEVPRKQFVTFFIGDQCMAFEMERVMEIVRVPPTVEVPMTPSSLIGLANLRGTILPVLCLRRVMGLDDAELTDATRVMVLSYFGRPLGFIVDKVTQVLGVQPEVIERIDPASSTFDSKLLSGVLKNIGSQPLIQLMDVDALTRQEYQSFSAVNENQKSDLSQQAHKERVDDEEEEKNIRQLVSFSVCGQEYSFDISATKEIIRMPETVNAIPKAPAYLVGMVKLRDRVLPLVRLSTLFGLPVSEALNETNRVVVLSLSESQQSVVGVIVDDVKEVLRIRKEQVEDVPPLLLDGREMRELEGICQLDKGKRIVTLLSASKMFRREDLAQTMQSVAAQHHELGEQDEESLQGLSATGVPEGESRADIVQDEDESQLVVFNLGEQEYGVSIESVREILRLPSQLTKVPKTSEFVEGMVNLRGMVLPIIDMRTRFGLVRQSQNDRQRIVVLNKDDVLTGYIVDSVTEVMPLQSHQIESAPQLSEEQASVMGRLVNLRDKKRIITVLEPEQLLSHEEQRKLFEEINECDSLCS